MVLKGAKAGSKTSKAPIKVKQEMIDFIKTQGMTRALKRAGSIRAKGSKGEAEFLEGVRRMYGANRLKAATKTSSAKKSVAKKAVAKKANGSMAYTAGSAKNNKATYTTGSGVNYASSTTKKAAAKKTKPRFGGFSMLSAGLSKKKDTSSAAYQAEQARLLAKWNAGKAEKKK